MYEYQGKVVHVVDGDTLDVSLDLGLETYRTVRLRLYGINARERFTEAGKEALQTLKSIFDNNPNVTVKTIKDRSEKYGRYLAIVIAPDQTNINEWLVQCHLAEKTNGSP